MTITRIAPIIARLAQMPGCDLGKSGHRALKAAGVACILAVTTAGAAHAVNRVGWVWANQPDATSPYTPDTSYSYNSTGGTVTVVPFGGGVYRVDFGGLYDGAPDDVQVSAYSTSGTCESADWYRSAKNTLSAYVQCTDANANLTDSYFTLLYQSRSARFGSANNGLAYLFADQPAVASYTPVLAHQYNSTGGTNTIVRNSVGNYTATLPGLTGLGGDAQVTPWANNEGASGFRCNVGSWYRNTSGGTNVNISCFDPGGVPADVLYDLAYAIKEPFGLVNAATSRGAWAWANNDSSTSVYTPSTTYQYNGFGTGSLTAQETSLGNYTVTIPGRFAYTTSDVLVTAYSNGSNYCNVAGWQTTTVEVACYSQGGTPVESQFDVTFQTFN